MTALQEKLEKQIIDVIKKVCKGQKINETVNPDFCPGNFIKSHVLVSIVPEIEAKTGINIPLKCYIFNNNNKDKEQLSITNAVKKLLKVTKVKA